MNYMKCMSYMKCTKIGEDCEWVEMYKIDEMYETYIYI